MTKREQFKQFLLQEIENVKFEDGPTVNELLAVLYEAVEGLENLELGQIDEIFAPATTGFHGLHPAIVKRYQAYAVGSVLALKKIGDKVADAEKIVASAYGVDPDNLHKWRTTIPKLKDAAIREIVSLYKSRVKLPAPPRERILADIKRKGEIYREARGIKLGKEPD